MPVNETNTWKINNNVEIADTSQAQVAHAAVQQALTLIEEIKALTNAAAGLQSQWKGDAKVMHDDLYTFCTWYGNDLTPALQGYSDALAILDEEVTSLASESNSLRNFKNVTKI